MNSIEYSETAPSTINLASRTLVNDIELIVPLPTEMWEQETVRLKKAFEKLQISCAKTQAQFDKFSESGKAPEEVMKKLQESLDQQRREIYGIEKQLSILTSTGK